MTADTILNKQRPAEVLLIEDNKGDVILTRRAFKEARILNNVMVAGTGEEALAILNKEENYANNSLPDLILLDLNLPKMDGKEVLQIIKSDPRTKHIPVIILSSSRAEGDVAKSYNLHANGYIVKPVSLHNFNEIIQKLEQFWFTLVVTLDEGDMKGKA